MFIGIVATAKNLAIGKDGKLPWHYPADLKYFKQTTTGNAIVMGWNTWESLGKPLPNRLNVVLSRRGTIDDRPDVKLVRDKEDVLELEKKIDGDVFIIGGSQTFKTFAPDIEKWYVTEIPIHVYGADTFMSRDFLDGFELEEEIRLDEELVVKVFQRK